MIDILSFCEFPLGQQKKTPEGVFLLKYIPFKPKIEPSEAGRFWKGDAGLCLRLAACGKVSTQNRASTH